MDKNKSKYATPENDDKLYKTYIITTGYHNDPETNLTIPEYENVVQAKDWVDQNHL
ncbi:MAG: DUF3787 domain-containing protein [Eubacteriales bacterium]|nr:DUF3787 domain-containing protein [Eubacteriales bacterium]